MNFSKIKMEDDVKQLCSLKSEYNAFVSGRKPGQNKTSLRAQRRLASIAKMRKELAALKTATKIAHHPVEDRNQLRDLQCQVRCQTIFKNNVHFQRLDLDAIDNEIKFTENRIAKLRKNFKPNNDDELVKHLQKLENKLDLKTKQYCTMIAGNEKFREEIQILLKKRQSFNTYFNKMVKRLAKGKIYLMETLENANSVFDQHETYLMKLTAIGERFESKQVLEREKMHLLQRRRNDKIKLREFMQQKGSVRVMVGLQEKKNEKIRAAGITQQQMLWKYGSMLDEIREFVGEQNVSSIAKVFMQKEYENMSMFNFAIQMHRESVGLAGDILKLHRTIQVHHERKEDELKRQEESNDTIYQQIYLYKAQADLEQKRLESLEKKLNDLKIEFRDLFDYMHCNYISLRDKLGKPEELNTQTLLDNLKIMSDKLDKIMDKAKQRLSMKLDSFSTLSESSPRSNSRRAKRLSGGLKFQWRYGSSTVTLKSQSPSEASSKRTRFSRQPLHTYLNNPPLAKISFFDDSIKIKEENTDNQE